MDDVRGWAHCDRRLFLELLSNFSMAAVATFGSVWVSSKLFSRVLLLLFSDTILKAIKHETPTYVETRVLGEKSRYFCYYFLMNLQ